MIIHVDTGEPLDEAVSPAEALSRGVDRPLERALQAPAAAQPRSRVRLPVVGAADCSHVTIPVVMGQRTLSLACTEDAMWGYVATAWVQGGFSGVVRARAAIDEAIKNLGAVEGNRRGNADDMRDRADRAGRHEHPTPTQQYQAAVWGDAARRSADEARGAKGAADRGRACAHAYATLFRDVWQVLALVEEELLRDYEKVAVPELTRIAEANSKIAIDEWKKYGCHLKDDAARKPVDIMAGRENAADIRLTLDDTQLQGLYDTAHELRTLAVAIGADRSALDRGVEEARRQGADPTEQRRLRERAIEDRLESWRALRDKVGSEDPALLQIYGQVRFGRLSLAQFRLLIVEALLDVFEESARIVKDQIWLLGDEPLRIEPRRQDGGPAERSAYGDAAGAIADGDHWTALETYQLTVPASALIADKLRDTTVAKNAAWLHLPVRLAVHAKHAKDASRRRFTEPGTFENAAITHLWRALEASRKKQETSRSHLMLGLFVGAVLLAPFTGGGSLVAAGLVQAAFSASEIYGAIRAYQADDQLARSTLTSMETALWIQPSSVPLVQLVAARLLGSAGGVSARIPFVVDLALSAAAMAIEPEKS